MHYGVLDLETQKLFSEVGGRKKLHDLKISVAGYYDSEDDQYIAYEEKEIPILEERLKKLDLLVGFNIIGFDLPVLQPYILTETDSFPTLDLMVEIQKVRGHRVTLQSVVMATLNDAKSGKGYDAVDLYRQGKMEALKEYCIDDVRLTKEAFDYGLKNGKVFFRSNLDYQNHAVEATWSDIEPFLKKPESSFPTGLF